MLPISVQQGTPQNVLPTITITKTQTEVRTNQKTWHYKSDDRDIFCVYELTLDVHVICYSSFFSICPNFIGCDPVDNTCYSQCENNNMIICSMVDWQNIVYFNFLILLHWQMLTGMINTSLPAFSIPRRFQSFERTSPNVENTLSAPALDEVALSK